MSETSTAPWYHVKHRNRGRKKPRIYSVEVAFEQDQRDFEQAAFRLGQSEMSHFFNFAARVLLWILTEGAFRDEQAEARREQERRDHEERAEDERRVRLRQERESRRLSQADRDLWRREQELAAREREGKPLQPEAKP